MFPFPGCTPASTDSHHRCHSRELVETQEVPVRLISLNKQGDIVYKCVTFTSAHRDSYLKGSCTGFNAMLFEILKFLIIFEQEHLCFHFSLHITIKS